MMEEVSKRMHQIRPTGVYKGIVVDNRFPFPGKKPGMVKVRIPAIHGKAGEGAWAHVCRPPDQGYDFGTFMVPEVGTVVFVMFEDGDFAYPVVMGSHIRWETEEQHEYGKDEDAWNTRAAHRSDMFEDAFQVKDKNVHYKKCVYKSVKGHSIIMDDEPGKEKLLVLDRVGNTLYMQAAKDEIDYENHRVDRMSINSENESFPLPMIKNQKSKIGIRDVVGQIFRMIVDNVSEASIELLSTVFDKTKTAGLLMYNKNNPKSILFQTVDMGNGYKLEYTNKQMLSMQLFVGGKPVFILKSNAGVTDFTTAGPISIISQAAVTVSAPNVRITGGVVSISSASFVFISAFGMGAITPPLVGAPFLWKDGKPEMIKGLK